VYFYHQTLARQFAQGHSIRRIGDPAIGKPGGAWRMPVIFEWKTLRSLYGSKTQTAKVVLKST
jgi:hypothetical protein